MTPQQNGIIPDTEDGLPQQAGSCCSGFDAGANKDPDAEIADEMLEGGEAQGALDFHDQATANKSRRHAQGGQ